MTTRSTSNVEAYSMHSAGRAESDGDAERPTQPDTERKPQGEPAKPTEKPLPDLPNPAEVGEDG